MKGLLAGTASSEWKAKYTSCPLIAKAGACYQNILKVNGNNVIVYVYIYICTCKSKHVYT